MIGRDDRDDDGPEGPPRRGPERLRRLGDLAVQPRERRVQRQDAVRERDVRQARAARRRSSAGTPPASSISPSQTRMLEIPAARPSSTLHVNPTMTSESDRRREHQDQQRDVRPPAHPRQEVRERERDRDAHRAGDQRDPDREHGALEEDLGEQPLPAVELERRLVEPALDPVVEGRRDHHPERHDEEDRQQRDRGSRARRRRRSSAAPLATRSPPHHHARLGREPHRDAVALLHGDALARAAGDDHVLLRARSRRSTRTARRGRARTRPCRRARCVRRRLAARAKVRVLGPDRDQDRVALVLRDAAGDRELGVAARGRARSLGRVPSSRFVLPMNLATNAVAGSPVDVERARRPARSRPLSITTTRSDIVIASRWSCVTMIVVIPSCCCSRRSSTWSCSRRFASSADSGSSSRNSRGSSASARAVATRCRCPPDSCEIRRSPSPPSETSSSSSSTRARIFGAVDAADPHPVADVAARP